MNGTFELTGRCNLSCKMCLVRVNQERIKELQLRERTAREWIRMAEEVRDAGTLSLLLTGGEVMLRADFCEIYEAISQMGFLLSVYTNATMVTNEIMKLFEKYPPHKIGVTMYGACNETYDRLCNCVNGYDKFLEGIEKLSTLPSLFDIRTTIVQDNLEDLSRMKEFTVQKFGEDKILHISRNVVDKIRGGIASPREVRLTPKKNVELVYPWILNIQDQIKDKKRGTVTEKLNLKCNREKFKGQYIFENCGAGINEYTISWSGRMYACGLLNDGYTEPFINGFEDAWGKLPEVYPKDKKIEKCESCKYIGLCETCPANRLAETGDWFGVPQYACDEAKEIYQILSKMDII